MSAPANFPDVGVPLTDPKTGRVSMVWFQLLIALFTRSGGESGQSGSDKVLSELFQQIASQVPVDSGVSLRIADVEAALAALAGSTAQPEPESFVPTHGIQDAPDLHALATQTASGFMSGADKAKLDAMTATVEDRFVAGTGFTPGTTTSLTLSKSYASSAAVLVHFDTYFQGTDQYTIAGNTITFTSAIPVGIQTVYARG